MADRELKELVDVAEELQEKPSIQGDLEHDSRTLLVAFGGFGGELGMPLFEFGRFTDRFAAKRLFVRDIRQAWYQFGLEGISETLRDTAGFLQEQVVAQKAERVIMIGNSMGGYAALLFGHLLGAAEVHAFSPQTFIGRWRRYATGDLRWRHHMRRIHRRRDIDRQYWDLVPILRAPSAHSCTYHIHYCSKHRLDTIHAQRMRKCPRVSVHGYDDGGHGLVRMLRDSGMLQKLLTGAGLQLKTDNV